MATATGQAPRLHTFRIPVAAVAAGSDLESPLGVSKVTGTITRVSYIPVTVLTGANTNSRTLSVLNKGQAGSGTTATASKAFVSTVNAPALDETALTLSGTAADLDVAAGDVLSFKSLHVGTGLADPGGIV